MRLSSFNARTLFGAVALAAAAGAASGAQPAWADFVERDFPFFSSVLDARRLGNGLPADNLTPRGIILNLGAGGWVCFDLDLLRVAAVWTGSGVTPVSMAQGSYHVAGRKAPEGQEALPEPVGTVWVANGIYPGWQSGESCTFTDPRDPGPDPREVGRGPMLLKSGRFEALRLMNRGVRLEYRVGNTAVQERITGDVQPQQRKITRQFRLNPVSTPLWLLVGRKSASPAAQGLTLTVTARSFDKLGRPGAERRETPDGCYAVYVHPSEEPVEFEVTLALSGRSEAVEPEAVSASPKKSSSGR
jgi:hypothetical protein